MAKDIIKNIPLTLDINARKRLNGTVDIRLYSKDIATGQFEFTLIDENENPVVLDETYSAQALVKYEGDSKTYLNDMIIEGNIIRFIFPHDFITKDGTITMYIYITKDSYTSDVAAISFPVFVSEIDKDLDPSISVHYIGKIEKLIQDMKDEMSSYQVDVDEIIAGYEESITKLQILETNYEPQLTSLTAQLAQTEAYPFTSKQVQTTSFSPKPIVVFTFDDAPEEDLTVIKPMFDEFGYKGTIYAIPGLVGTTRVVSGYTINYMTNEQLRTMADAGWEIGAHTMTHIPMGGATETTIEYEMGESKKVLQDWGFNVTNFAYPFGSVDNLSKRISTKHFRSATVFNGSKTSVDAPINKPALPRKALGSFFDAVDSNFPDTNTFEGYYKHWVDDAKNNNRLTIFALHSFAMDAQQLSYLRDTLAYCQSEGVSVMTLDDALNYYDNAIDFKVYNPDNSVKSELMFDAKGDLSSGNMVFSKRIPSSEKNKYPQTALPEVYPDGVSYIAISDGSLWSVYGGSVIVHTDKAFGVPDVTRQWIYQRWGTGIMYRSATNTGEWSPLINLTPSAPAPKFSVIAYKPLPETGQDLLAGERVVFNVPNSNAIAHTETIVSNLINQLPKGIVYSLYNGGAGIKIELQNVSSATVWLPTSMAFNIRVI